jgi:uncharacterized membrane protein
MSPRHRRIALVATPAYGLSPWVSILLAPVALAVLALGVLRNTRPARTTAWVALAVLGLWFAENVAAIDQIAPRIPYWPATLFPMSVAAAYLWRTR